MGKLKHLIWLLPISGLAIIIMGGVMFFTSLDNIVTLTVLFGVFMLVSGIAELVSYFSKERANRSGSVLGSGILTALFGLWMLFGSRMDDAEIIIPFVFAAWIMASGVVRIVDAFSRKSVGGKLKFWVFVFGLLGTLFGFTLLFNPLMSEMVTSRLLAVMMVIHGLGTILLFFRLRKQIYDVSDDASDGTAGA